MQINDDDDDDDYDEEVYWRGKRKRKVNLITIHFISLKHMIL